MIWRKSKVPYRYLVGLLVLILFFILSLEISRTTKPDPLYPLKITAATKMEKALSIAGREVSSLIDPEVDPNRTGLIGKEFTPMSTTMGSLLSKRTSTNPDFAALLIHLLDAAGVKKGDAVAIRATGSFPALNLATLIAVETYQARPILISSIGASTWGANQGQWTWLDMENFFYQRGIIHHRSQVVSLGGGRDAGQGFWEGGLEMAHAAIARNPVPLLETANLNEAIEANLAIFDQYDPVLYINIGGSHVNFGDCDHYHQLPGGLTKKLVSCYDSGRGLLIRFSERGLPVVNLLNIPELATTYGLAIDPIPLPEIGQSSIYFSRSYSPVLVIVSFVTILAYLGWVIRKQRRDAHE